jgi:hypothetical protein
MQPDQPAYEESKLTALLAQDSEYAFQLLFDRYRNPDLSPGAPLPQVTDTGAGDCAGCLLKTLV